MCERVWPSQGTIPGMVERARSGTRFPVEIGSGHLWLRTASSPFPMAAKAEIVIDVQKKVAMLLGIPIAETEVS